MPDFNGNFGPARLETAGPTANTVSDADEVATVVPAVVGRFCFRVGFRLCGFGVLALRRNCAFVVHGKGVRLWMRFGGFAVL